MAHTQAEQKGPVPLPIRVALSALAAAAAEGVTYPIDMTKTRLQLQGQGVTLARGQRIGAFATARLIVTTEGTRGLYRGIAPALVRHVIYTPTRVLLYENFREHLEGHSASPRHYERMAAGFASGALSQLLASPADLVKVRMQADGRQVALGIAPRYSGMMDAFTKIVKVGGVRGLWKGCAPNVGRAALVNLGELSTYDLVKKKLLHTGYFHDNLYCHVASSSCSGFVAAVVSSPADVVKTRMMSAHTAHHLSAQYRTSLGCLMHVITTEGPLALWKGFLPTWFRLAPWQFVFWVSYERLRAMAGVGGF